MGIGGAHNAKAVKVTNSLRVMEWTSEITTLAGSVGGSSG